ncbi:MAG: hypothetical protein SF028_13025 [Candidatus Sumerlaeia bacterium]|nr:hypothetical protein [Candidatus Sumerlaeia bacterium]
MPPAEATAAKHSESTIPAADDPQAIAEERVLVAQQRQRSRRFVWFLVAFVALVVTLTFLALIFTGFNPFADNQSYLRLRDA